MTIEIEDKILRKANVRFATSSFLMVGVVGVGITTNLGLVGLAGIAFPFMLDGFLTRIRLKKCNPFALDGGIFGESYKKMFRNWFSGYVNNSESLTEKKYKAICVNLWVRYKKLLDRSMLDGNDDFIDKLSYELKSNNETQDYLYNIFNNSIFSTMGGSAGANHPLDFILEDEKNEEKLQIAKKVYADFSQSGMAGEFFLWGGKNFEALMRLQNYKFTDLDMQIIKNYVIETKKNFAKYGINAIARSSPCSDEELLYTILSNESDTKRLEVLKQVYMLGTDSISRMSQKETEKLISFVDNKIKATDMMEKLENDLVDKEIKPVKRNKI